MEEDTLSEWKISKCDISDETEEDRTTNLAADKRNLEDNIRKAGNEHTRLNYEIDEEFIKAFLETDSEFRAKRNMNKVNTIARKNVFCRIFSFLRCCTSGSNIAKGLGASKYSFSLHDRKYSSEGKVYQRLDFEVCVERQFKNVFITIIAPTTLLAITSSSVFTLDDVGISGNIGNRLQVIVLAIIANQFVSQGRLPYLAYYTWIDFCLISCQLFVYLNVIESAIVLQSASLHQSLHPNSTLTPEHIDLYLFYSLLGLCILLLLTGSISACCLRNSRTEAVKKFVEESKMSFDEEESRLKRLRKKFYKQDSEHSETRPVTGISQSEIIRVTTNGNS